MTSLPVSTSSSSSSSAAANSPSLAPKQTAQEKALSEKLKKIAQKMLSGPPSAFASFTKPTASSLAVESSMADEVFAFGNARPSSLDHLRSLDDTYTEQEKENFNVVSHGICRLLDEILSKDDLSQIQPISEKLIKSFHEISEHNSLQAMMAIVQPMRSHVLTELVLKMHGRIDKQILYLFYFAVLLSRREAELPAGPLMEAIELALEKEDICFLSAITSRSKVNLYSKFTAFGNISKQKRLIGAIETATVNGESNGKSEEYLALLAKLKEQITNPVVQTSFSCLEVPF